MTGGRSGRLTLPGETPAPRFNGLDAVLCVGTGFAIWPLVNAIETRDYVRVVLAVVYLAWAWTRLWARIPSLRGL
jgi:hypothetical protein